MKKVQHRVLALVTLFSLLSTSVYAASQSSSATIDVVTLANTPSNLTINTAQATDTSLPVQWEVNGNPSNTGYTLEMSPDNSTWTILQNNAVDDLSETATNLSANTKYYFRVSSYNQDSPAKTNGQYATGEFFTKPAKPSTPTGAVNGLDITLNWENVAGTTTKVFNAADELQTTVPSDTSKTYNGVTPNTQYQYYIVHTNQTGDSVPSDKVILWTDANPPSNLAVTNRTETSIDVSIDANGNPEGTEYQYRITKSDGTPVSVTDWMTDLTHSFSGLVAGQYRVIAKARNSASNTVKPLQETAEIELTTGTVPVAPKVEITPTETSLEVTLAPQSDTTNVEFKIVLKDENGTEVASTDWSQQGAGWASSSLAYTFDNLSPNKKYKVQAEARYAD